LGTTLVLLRLAKTDQEMQKLKQELFNELLQEKNEAFEEHEDALERVNDSIDNLVNEGGLTACGAIEHYFELILYEQVLENITNKTAEFKAVVDLYKEDSILFRGQVQDIQITEQELRARKQSLVTKKHELENYLTGQGVSLVHLHNETKWRIKRVQEKRALKERQKAQKRKSSLPPPENYKGPKKPEIKNDKKTLHHIFRDKKGHLKDTPQNRKLLIDLASDENNFKGPDIHGNRWYSKQLSGGRQAWARVRDNYIESGGINDTARTYNFQTGLCQLKEKL